VSIQSLWLIGCGNMAGAMLRRWIEAGATAPAQVFVMDRQALTLPAGVEQGQALPADGMPDAVLLGVKPQQLDDVTAALADRLSGVPLLMSIRAGVEEPALAARLDAGAIVRIMPNLPVALGKGVVALNSASADADARTAVGELMGPLGRVEWIEADQFDAVTALASCGPAFLYRFIDALAAGAAALGLPADQALRLALATVEGAGAMAAAADDDPGVLADRVASPGGSTREGLNVLDEDQALVRLLSATLAASARRNAEMAAAARSAGERPPR
jgi:pyrroline-5-carboxylate reductase